MFALAGIGYILTVAQLSYSQNVVICVPGQCLEGTSNTTIGARLSVPGQASRLHLLPGQYSADTDPLFLRNVITDPAVTITSSQGFSNSTALPLNLTLSPGIATYSGPLYSGNSTFTGAPSMHDENTTIPLTALSLALSDNLVATIFSSNNQLILWESVPDLASLPSSFSNGPFALGNLESLACSSPCSRAGVCTTSGSCQCGTGFTGDSCESCSPNFFGPRCQACPRDCDSCDDGINGSGRCLKALAAELPSTCDCVNGICGQDGKCTCTTGWETAANGTACSQCADGFFLTDQGDCTRCGVGCERCEDSTGRCTLCRSGFVRNATDTSGDCKITTQTGSDGLPCPDGSFPSAGTCAPCDPSCATCTGGTSADCATCPRDQAFDLNGRCVKGNSDGVCPGSSAVVDLVKLKCNACGSKCTSCRLPGFNGVLSPVIVPLLSERICTGCIPGFVISGKDCVESCPNGTFASIPSNSTTPTCAPCFLGCTTCAGSANFCLSCPGNQFASNGTCVDSCPNGTFNAPDRVCKTCHPDCASCTGGNFDQCSSCPASSPVLSNGRCLPRCNQTQFFDRAAETCQPCDSSCGSCSGSGSENCLSCSSAQHVLRGGTCQVADCVGSDSVIAGLGVCLSELVVVSTTTPQSSDTTSIISETTSALSTDETDDRVLNTGANQGLNLPSKIMMIIGLVLGSLFLLALSTYCFFFCRNKIRRRRERATETPLFLDNEEFPSYGSKQENGQWGQ